MAGARPLVVLASNRAYLPWVRVFLASLTRFHPDVPVVLCGVNLRSGHLRPLRARHRELQMMPVSVRESGRLPDPNVANSRPIWYRRVMEEFDAPVYWFMDADLLVRGSLRGLTRLVDAHDAALVFRFERYRHVPIRMKKAAGLLVLRRSARTLLDHWIAAVGGTSPVDGVRPGRWFWEQSCLHLASRRARLRYARIPPDEYLSTYPFDRQARIWSANVRPDLKPAMLRIFRRELAR
jgi:hypothetical protein